MSDRQQEQATAEEVRALVMAGVRTGADLRPAALGFPVDDQMASDKPPDRGGALLPSQPHPRPEACPGCGRGAGLWCAPWCEYADPGEPCPDCGADWDCHPWCPRREVPGE